MEQEAMQADAHPMTVAEAVEYARVDRASTRRWIAEHGLRAGQPPGHDGVVRVALAKRRASLARGIERVPA